MSTTPLPVTDEAQPILAGDSTLSDESRGELWDAFHSKSPEELAQHLQSLAVPDDTKRKLVDAKQRSTVAVSPVSKVTAAISQLAKMPPDVLDLAETHPNVLKSFTAAATTPEKEPTAAPGASAGASKGKQASQSTEAAPLAQPPRPDGLPHLPPIPQGHRRVLASDGNIHDIPEERVEDARKLDPLMHVLNP